MDLESARFLLAVAVVLVVAHLAGALVRRIGQPPVVGEILAGLLLGPAVLGALDPSAWEWLFPREILGTLELVGQLGIVAFMLVLGMELRIDRLAAPGRTVPAVALAGLLVPFAFAVPVGFLLYDGHGGQTASRGGFVLFFGLALSITALPVLARILADRGMLGSRLSTLALSAAGLGDLIAWAALAFVLAGAGGGWGPRALWTLTLATGYLLCMVLLVRPAMATLTRQCEGGRLREQVFLPIVLSAAITSALAAQLIGLHAVIGALVFGAVLPKDSPVTRRVRDRTEGLTLALLLPIFFAYIGLHTHVGTIGASARSWLLWAAILLLAMSTKVGGVAVAAKVSGVPSCEALRLGVLMNCRGLTELVIADVGYQAGIIDGYLFAALVLIALVTTALTGPLLTLLSRVRSPVRESEATACLKPRGTR